MSQFSGPHGPPPFDFCSLTLGNDEDDARKRRATAQMQPGMGAVAGTGHLPISDRGGGGAYPGPSQYGQLPNYWSNSVPQADYIQSNGAQVAYGQVLQQQQLFQPQSFGSSAGSWIYPSINSPVPDASQALNFSHQEPQPDSSWQNVTGPSEQALKSQFFVHYGQHLQLLANNTNDPFPFDSFWKFCEPRLKHLSGQDLISTYLCYKAQYHTYQWDQFRSSAYNFAFDASPEDALFDNGSTNLATSDPVEATVGSDPSPDLELPMTAANEPKYQRIAPALPTEEPDRNQWPATPYSLQQSQIQDASHQLRSSTSVPSTPDTSQRQYTCGRLTNNRDVCGMSFNTYRDLQRHHGTQRHGGNNRVIMCVIHNKGFRGRSDALLRHLKSKRHHSENELRQFYASRSGQRWNGSRDDLYATVRDLMCRRAQLLPPAAEAEDGDEDDADVDMV